MIAKDDRALIVRRLWIGSVAVTLLTAVLPTLQAQRLGPRDVDALPSNVPTTTLPYGPGTEQFGDLRLPTSRGPFPVAIVIHGGCWRPEYSLKNTAALADALRDAGVATWNVEYRRLNQAGGGWPGTFRDVSDAADYLRKLVTRYPLDLSHVVAVGHSAGGHLALWLAARHRLPAASELKTADPLKITAAIALGGPGDLRDFTTYAANICGTPVIEQLLGGPPAAQPARYAQASPIELLPLGVRQTLIVGTDDGVMPKASRDAYVAAARKAGDSADVLEVPGGHFEVIAPMSTAWPIVRASVLAAAGVKR